MVSVPTLPAPSVARTVMLFAPAARGIERVHGVTTGVTDVNPPPFDHSSVTTGLTSDVVPLRDSGVRLVGKLLPLFVVIVTVGPALSRTAVKVATGEDRLFAASLARTSIVLGPSTSVMPEMVQLFVPEETGNQLRGAVVTFRHSTSVMGEESEAVPASGKDASWV